MTDRIAYWANVQKGIDAHKANTKAAQASVQAVTMIAKAQQVAKC